MKKLYLILMLLFVQACSVHTLHSYDESLHTKLSQVKLGGISARDEYFVRRTFHDEFYISDNDDHKEKRYELNLTVSDEVEEWLVHNESEVLRNDLTVIVDFTLKDLKTNKIVKAGKAKSLGIFPVNVSAWSTYTAEKKAYENALKDALRNIRIHVMLHLTKHSKEENENKTKRSK